MDKEIEIILLMKMCLHHLARLFYMFHQQEEGSNELEPGDSSRYFVCKMLDVRSRGGGLP